MSTVCIDTQLDSTCRLSIKIIPIGLCRLHIYSTVYPTCRLLSKSSVGLYCFSGPRPFGEQRGMWIITAMPGGRSKGIDCLIKSTFK